MGGVVSTGHDNDDLISNLLHAEYIKTEIVEQVFRAVDRADYFLEEARNNAYKDLAWKNGNLHISAPCIYSEVMEALALKPGLSFLNLGSGTGYLSTMVGLVLGTYGVNHGIEIHEDVVQYANSRLEEFKKKSAALDTFEFCTPKFVQGNCLCLNSDFPQYDRVYCGAACPENHANYMKNLIKVGGILVMPLNDKLVQFLRTSETTWTENYLLSVSFASLISAGQHEPVKMLDFEPLSLQEICRATIRTILRQNIDIEYPDIKKSLVRKTPKKPKKKKEGKTRKVVPIFEETDDIETSDNMSEEDDRPEFRRIMIPPDGEMAPSGRELNSMISLVLGLQRRENQIEHSENSGIDADVDTENHSFNESSSEMKNSGSDIENDSNKVVNESETVPNEGNKPNVSKREKLDSGLGEDLLNDKNHSSDSEATCGMEVDTDSEDTSSTCDRSHKRTPFVPPFVRTGGKLKRIALSRHCLYNFADSDSDSDMNTEEEKNLDPVVRFQYVSPYTSHIRAKIQALPLPPMLKNYLHLYREF